MAARKEIREFDLLEFSRCLLRQPHLIPYSKPLEVQAAEQTVRLALWQMFEKKVVPDSMAIRDLLITAWEEVREDASGLHGLATRVSRIRELITTFNLVSPVTHYAQKLGATAITGDYAVLSPLSQMHLRDVLILRLRMRDEFPKGTDVSRPDVVNWARWLHLQYHEPALNSIRILNFGIDFDAQWEEGVSQNSNLVRAALTGLADSAQSGRYFPSPGRHCDSCQTRACVPNEGE